MNINDPLQHRMQQGGVFLNEYGVYFGREQMGTVRVMRQGLYYQFICRCRLTGGAVCRLLVRCGNNQENLGVVVPIADEFGLETRLPIKRLGEGTMVFSLHPKHEKSEGTFVPIYPAEPFAYIARLKESFLISQNGIPGIKVAAKT